MNSTGHGGTRSLLECGSNEKDEDQKKEGLRRKISTVSGCRLKILAIFLRILK